jgi:hypothetical protein
MDYDLTQIPTHVRASETPGQQVIHKIAFDAPQSLRLALQEKVKNCNGLDQVKAKQSIVLVALLKKFVDSDDINFEEYEIEEAKAIWKVITACRHQDVVSASTSIVVLEPLCPPVC